MSLPPPCAISLAELVAVANTDAKLGLTHEEAAMRLRELGPNDTPLRLPTFCLVFWEEIREPLQLMLVVIGVLYAVWGELTEAIVAWVVIILAVLVEIASEYRAKTALARLRQSDRVTKKE